MAVALDRAAIRLNIGGAFAGEFADGFIKPNIGADYAPTGFWTDLLREGDPGHRRPGARKEADRRVGRGCSDARLQLPRHPDQPEDRGDRDRLARQGWHHGHAGADRAGQVLQHRLRPGEAGDFGTGGWGADWPNASTVIPPLFTVKGGWDLSQLDDAAFNAKVDAALTELDRAKQATLWQALNKEAAEKVYAIPTFFGLSQTIAGTKVAPAYRWAAYGSWPYGAMYVKP